MFIIIKYPYTYRKVKNKKQINKIEIRQCMYTAKFLDDKFVDGDYISDGDKYK